MKKLLFVSISICASIHQGCKCNGACGVIIYVYCGLFYAVFEIEHKNDFISKNI